MTIEIIHEKIPMELRRQRLTVMEESLIEDILVDSFLENEILIKAAILRCENEAKLLTEPIERVEHQEKLVTKVSELINRRWGGREKGELESLSWGCIHKFWILTDIERAARDERNQKLEMMRKNASVKKDIPLEQVVKPQQAVKAA